MHSCESKEAQTFGAAADTHALKVVLTADP
jgi:hypothetical protein